MTLATHFYQRLFNIAPHLRPMFPVNLGLQKQKLVDTLQYAVDGLSHPETIVNQVRMLGLRHISYGVQPSHYDIVGEALLWAIQQQLGTTYNDEIEQAWVEAYTTLAQLMKDGSNRSHFALNTSSSVNSKML